MFIVIKLSLKRHKSPQCSGQTGSRLVLDNQIVLIDQKLATAKENNIG